MTDETDSIIHGNLLNNVDFQDVINCDKNNESQQLPNEQLGESWFSPPITSTQIVSFDLISSDGDYSQDELLSGNQKQNILVDLSEDGTISSDEIMQFTDPAYFLALSPLCDQTNVSETPPPQGESLNWENRNVTDYLFNSSNLITVESSNNISITTVRVPSKRLSLQEKSKKPAKIKKPKVEGYTCKLNGKMYQVFSRDLDVLEAIERGLKVIQEKIRQQGMCNVRPLCLQLNQIETVLGILDNEQLEQGIPLEVWKEMMAVTKAMFNETQHEVNLCKKRRFELETFTDELTASFSHSFNISGSEQTKDKSSQQLLTFNKKDENTENVLVRTPDATSHYESQTLRSDMTVEIEQENGIQLSGVSQQINDTITQESANKIPEKTSTQTTLRRQRSFRSIKKKSSKKSDAPNTSGTFKESYKSTLPGQNVLRMDTLTDGFRRPDEVDLNLPLAQDSIYERNPSQAILSIPSTDTTKSISGNYLEVCQNPFSSTLNANESLLSQKNLQVNDSQLNPVRVTISNCFNSSQQIEEIVIAENVKATNYQDESFIVEASQNSTLSLFSEKNRKCLPKIVMMSFNLHPFVLKGVLSPGKNNMKMNINNRIYIGSLTPDGTIEMNGFSFPTIGNWIKSVEGKRFGSLSRTVQKTLELQYNGKPLVEVLDEGGKLNKSLSKENVEISPSDFTQHPKLQDPKVNSNLPLKTAPVTQVQTPTSQTQTTDEIGQKNAISNNDLNIKEDLQLVPDEMTRHIKTIFLHAPDEYFPICQCVEQFWCGAQPFPKHLLDEVDSW